MTTLEAIILGIVQGLTEFLPVSSSGHLKLAQYLFGFEKLDSFLMFDLVCHLGTLGAIFIVFFKPLKITLLHHRKRIWLLLLGTLPLFPIALFLGPIKSVINSPQYLGYFFLLTALLLYVGPILGRRYQQHLSDPSTKGALTIGAFQALATLPGVSRSGATISAGLGVGLERSHAALFSFMLAIPATLGGITLLLLEAYLKGAPVASIDYLQYALGFGTSLGVGLLALRLVMRLVARDKFSIFVWYCLLLGLTTLIMTSGRHVEEEKNQKESEQLQHQSREYTP